MAAITKKLVVSIGVRTAALPESVLLTPPYLATTLKMLFIHAGHLITFYRFDPRTFWVRAGDIFCISFSPLEY